MNTIKAAAESFLTNADESSLMEDDPSVRSGSEHLQNELEDRGNGVEPILITLQGSNETRGSCSIPVLSLISARILRPELALDYSHSQDPTPYMAYILEIKADTPDDGVLQWTEKTRYSKLKRLNEVLTKSFPLNTAR